MPGSSAPHQAQIDLADPDIFSCPYEEYDRLRVEAPIHRSRQGRFLSTRYDEVAQGFADHDHLSRDMVGFFDPARPTRTDLIWHSEEARRIFAEEGWDAWPHGAVLFADPPLHTRYRKFAEPMFSPKRVKAVMPFIEAKVHALIDDFAEAGHVEFVAEFATPLPMAVICHMLGFPEDDMPALKSWSTAMGDAMSGLQDERAEIACAKALVACQHYFVAELKERRSDPRDDILSEIAALEDNPDFGLAECLSLISSILIGGNESTTNALSSGLWLMLDTPGLADQLRAEPKLIRNFVEETLRLESPFQFFTRAVSQACVLGGQALAPGDLIDLYLGAANRDPSRFPDPSSIDLQRPSPASHLAFGAGIHRCLGNVLARIELQFAFETLLDRLDGMTLSPQNSFTRMLHPIFRGLEALHIDFVPKVR